MSKYIVGSRVLIKKINKYGSIISINNELFLVRFFNEIKYDTNYYQSDDIELSHKLNITVSFEIFPPKDHDLSINQIENLVENISKYNPPFISVTYGAMGSTKNNSTKVARLISEHGVIPLSHITCYNETKESINKFLSEIKDTNSKLLVLRGDTINQNNLDFYYASDLLSYLKDYKNEKGVAIYVEGHPESSSIDNDISILLMKNQLGAAFSITQMFFNNNLFFSFMDKIKDSPIKIIAGIMPVTRYLSLNRIKDFGNIYVPQELINNLKDANNENTEFEIGINYAYNQIINLVENGYDQIHIYTMNKINVVNRLMSLLDGAIS